MTNKDEALKMAIEALETAEVQSEYDGLSDMIFKAINACKEALEQPAQEVECSNHPDAPHGFCRDASHSAGRYVCECEGWQAEQPAWQGLTDDEMWKTLSTQKTWTMDEVARAIEAKLKEKNT